MQVVTKRESSANDTEVKLTPRIVLNAVSELSQSFLLSIQLKIPSLLSCKEWCHRNGGWDLHRGQLWLQVSLYNETLLTLVKKKSVCVWGRGRERKSRPLLYIHRLVVQGLWQRLPALDLISSLVSKRGFLGSLNRQMFKCQSGQRCLKYTSWRKRGWRGGSTANISIVTK